MGTSLPVYLDCAATSPMEPEVLEIVINYMRDEYGNAGSRHDFGVRAKRAVERAREEVATIVDAQPEEVIFTSGATESNNLAIIGLRQEAERTGRKHIVSTMIEHKAVLEPLQHLENNGFQVTLVRPDRTGVTGADSIMSHVRTDTLLVSVMAANNETGTVQPILAIADQLRGHPAYFHVDAAQSFGKDIPPLRSKRIDLLSASGHKIFGPKGIGALIARRRASKRPPISPLILGGGQERGMRSGTLPVALIAGMGVAAQLAARDHQRRAQACEHIKQELLAALTDLPCVINGDQSHGLPNVLNLSIPDVDSEAAILALRDLAAFSNGAACSSAAYRRSHVLAAMGLDARSTESAIRLSWCHLTGHVPATAIAERLTSLLG